MMQARAIPARVGLSVYVILSVVLLALYSSWNRPLWYDEMVYFVLGGLASVSDALSTIEETTTNVNQGTTGGYMLLDYLSLSAFGAQTWALRLPSLIFGLYFLAAAAIFLRGRGVGWLGLWGLILLLTGQQTLMYYAGEARTYMPLAAATAGVLAYYFVPLGDRKRLSTRVLGWSAVLIGVLFHPYFALYWPLILVFSVAVQHRWKALVRFANPALVVAGTSIFFIVASLTWLRGSARREELDPYLFLVDPLWRSIVAQMFQTIHVDRILVVVVGLTILVSAVLASPSWKQARATLEKWWPPFALLMVSFVAAVAISAVSIQQEFWIIPRQWIASIGLSSIALIWLFSVIIRQVLLVRGATAAMLIRAVVGLVLVAGAIDPIVGQVEQLRNWSADRTGISLDSVPTQAQLAEELRRVSVGEREPLSEDEWVTFSNANTLRGGPVWSEFGNYYSTRNWNEFVLRD